MGYKDAEALQAIKNRTDDAWRALKQECEVRPVIYSRAPAWYRFNIVSGKVKLTDGKAISTNPITIGAAGGDFDGDQITGTVFVSIDNKEVFDKSVLGKPLSECTEEEKKMKKMWNNACIVRWSMLK